MLSTGRCLEGERYLKSIPCIGIHPRVIYGNLWLCCVLIFVIVSRPEGKCPAVAITASIILHRLFPALTTLYFVETFLHCLCQYFVDFPPRISLHQLRAHTQYPPVIGLTMETVSLLPSTVDTHLTVTELATSPSLSGLVCSIENRGCHDY